MKIFLLILISLVCSTRLFAQGFEGEIIYRGHDSTGRKTGVTFFVKGDRQKMLFQSDTNLVEFFMGPDSLALVISGSQTGIILQKDSAQEYFRLLSKDGPDSLISTTPTTRTKTISGYHCHCIIGKLQNGKKMEYWLTSEVDSEVCYSFAHSKWNELSQSGTAEFIRNQNLSGNALISWTSFSKDENPIAEATIVKIGKRPVDDDEVNVSDDIFLVPVSPQTLVRAAKHAAKNRK